MREVVLDTETTGFEPSRGDRIVEIGCVELFDRLPTGREFHSYVNPDRDVPRAAEKVHGLNRKFLADHPRFAQVADKLLDFIGDTPIVAHNASFDMSFINAELRRLSLPQFPKEQALCTVKLAREVNPGKPAKLDDLIRRYRIPNPDREQHGALKDAKLLAQVYLELTGGRQNALCVSQVQALKVLPGLSPQQWEARLIHPTAAELAAHRKFLESVPNHMWDLER